MRIIILGAGAIGNLFGAHLAREHDVTLVCRMEHADAINRNGLTITGLSDIHVKPRAVASVEGLEAPDMLILTVKSYDTEKAVHDIRKLLSPGTILVSLQNGLGNMDILNGAFPDASIVYGITSQGAILRSPGIVEHTGRSYTMVGWGRAAEVAAILTGAGMETSASNDIQSEIWYKAIVNSVINTLGTLLKAKNGVVIEKPELAGLVNGIVSEGIAVAGACGVALEQEIAMKKVMLVATETANNICSMRLDIERGRMTEIMQMNGAIARYGQEHGIPTPVNSLLTALVKGLESGKIH